MQKHIQLNKDERRHFSGKYSSHFIERARKGYERFHCGRGELKTEQNCNILTSTLMDITAFLSRSPGLLNRRPEGTASLGHGPHSSIFSPTDLSLWTPTAQSGFLRAPPAGCWLSLQHRTSNWTWTSCAPSYIIVLRPLNWTCRQLRLSTWYLRLDAPVIYTGAFPILTARPGSICNIIWCASW